MSGYFPKLIGCHIRGLRNAPFGGLCLTLGYLKMSPNFVPSWLVPFDLPCMGVNSN